MAKKYRVEAHRSGNWWALEFPDVDDRIHSQARRLDQAPAMAADAIGLWWDYKVAVSPDDIEIVPILSKELHLVDDARKHRQVAEHATQVAQETTRAAARAARDLGLSVRDIGQLLDVSPSYAARLVK